MKKLGGRIPELDGIRGVAILMVIVWHYFCSQIHPVRHSALAIGAIPFSLCWSGVDLFFVLSGFLIGGILVDSRDSRNYFRVFYLRRVCRIAPIYFLLLASFGLAYLAADPHGRFAWLLERPLPALSYMTFTQNIVMGLRDTFGASWLAPTWSLAVEEQFYSLLPVLVWALPPRMLRVALAVAICSAPLLRSMCSELSAQVEMPMRSDSLLLGSMVAILVRSERFLDALRLRRRAFWGVFLVLLSGTAVMCVRAVWFGVFVQTWLSALYCTLLLVPFADPGSLVARVLRNRQLGFFGTISYSLYLVHEIVAGLLHGLVYGRAPRIDDGYGAALTAAAFVVSVLVARASFQWIEKKAVAVGHRYAYLPRGAGEAPAR